MRQQAGHREPIQTPRSLALIVSITLLAVTVSWVPPCRPAFANSVRTHGVEQSADTPRHFGIALDVSGSVAEHYPVLVGVTAATLAILPDKSTVSVVVFNKEAVVLAKARTIDDKARREIIEQLEKLKPSGATDLLAGVTRTLETVGDHSEILVFSDGFHSRQDQVRSAAETREQFAGITTTAIRQKTRIHALLYSAKQPPSALKDLVESSGGTYCHTLNDPENLVRQFVDLSAQVGRYWQRTASGELVIEANQVVTLVEHFNDSITQPGDTLTSSDPANNKSLRDSRFSLNSGPVRVTRFLLEPGSYYFEPPGDTFAILLRPSELRIHLPESLELPANRLTGVTLPVESNEASAPTSLSGQVLISGHDLPSVQTQITESEAVLEFGIPRATGSHGTLKVSAIQSDWHYTVGHIPVSIIRPGPIDVHIDLPLDANGVLKLQSAGVSPEVRIPVTIRFENAGLSPIEFHCQASDCLITPRMWQSDPADSVHYLTFARAGDPPQVDGTITFSVRTRDNDRVLIEGSESFTVPYSWQHTRPAIQISDLPASTVSLRRGSSVQIPLKLSTSHLETLKSRSIESLIQLIVDDGPQDIGFDLAADESLMKDANNATLTIRSAHMAEPGQHAVRARLVSLEESLRLNGSDEAVPFQFDLEIDPGELECECSEQPVQFISPIDSETHQVDLTIRAKDGGPLPEISCNPRFPEWLMVRQVSSYRTDTRVHQYQYEIEVPGQAAPASANVSFDLTTAGRLFASPSKPIQIIPANFALKDIEIVREVYPWWYPLPRNHCWFSARVEKTEAGKSDLSVSIAGYQYAVDPESSEIFQVLPDPESGMLPVELVCNYRHALLSPVDTVPVTTRITSVPVPVRVALWLIGLVGIATTVLKFMAWRSVKIEYAGRRRTLWRASLQKIIAFRQIRVKLRWTLDGSLFACRSSRSRHDKRFHLSIQRDGMVSELQTSSRKQLEFGDVIQVTEIETGLVEEVTIKSAPKPMTDQRRESHGVGERSGYSDFFSDQHPANQY